MGELRTSTQVVAILHLEMQQEMFFPPKSFDDFNNEMLQMIVHTRIHWPGS